MQVRPKRRKSDFALAFESLRWPFARAEADPEDQIVVSPHADDGVITKRRFVTVTVASGNGRRWIPRDNDASWRSLGELDLGDPAAVETFIRYRGDPFGQLKPGNPINTALWIRLVEALQLAASAWGPPGADGVSYPIDDLACISRAKKFLAHIAPPLQPKLASVQDVDEVGRMESSNLAAFLVTRAVWAMRPFLPHRKCQRCSMWFEVYQIKQGQPPRFCSPTCRSVEHEIQENVDGKLPKEHHQGRRATLAKRVVPARAKRQATAEDQKPRLKGRGARVREPDGAGS